MKDRIMNTCLPLSYKYEYLKSYNDILITFKYSSFAMEESLRALEKSLSLDILKFNVYLNGIHNYLKRYGNFYNLEGEYYNWLKGTNPMPCDALVKMSELFKVKTDYLLGLIQPEERGE